MTRWTTALAVSCGLAVAATPASAQILDRIGKGAKLAQKAGDLVFTEAEEVELGQKVSEEMRKRFGVVQDQAVHKYVTLVGAVLATSSTRPNLPWTFIVLDTDAVNAFAAPGGYVHVTKGLLALMGSEAELAGVLGHELIHITEKHTIGALKKSAATNLAVDASGKGDSKITSAVVGNMRDVLLKGFDRKEESESDEKGLALANKVGYAPAGLSSVLEKILERNKDSTEKRGLFASHPLMTERIKKIGEQIKRDKLISTATLEARYKSTISYKPVPQSEIAVVQEGAAGLAGGGSSSSAKKEDTTAKKEGTTAKKEEPPAEQPKKRGFGLSKLSSTLGGGDKKQAQVTGSGAGRGLGDPEVDAKGGGNPALVAVRITPADIEAFKKEGKLA